MRNLLAEKNRQYETVAQAITYIKSHAQQQPSLAEIAAAVHLSEAHLQRVFTEWAGISPKRFLQYLTKEHARQALRVSKDVLTASVDSGLSSPGRLHDLMISCEAMTPGEVKTHGQGVSVTYGISSTTFGAALIAWTARGICHLGFCDDSCHAQEQLLYSEWSAASMVRDDKGAEDFSKRIFSSGQTEKLHLLLRGTNFQIKVWEALLNIGSAQLTSYSTLARLADSPKAQRAVGSAVARNRIAFLIPCHRVIRENGDAGEYRWGGERKLAMQVWEAAR
jgi:AraC family transcriptional regulator of adaptative response/methylated-DNA-[protein]-cysteine methyltransferase